jgi:hypothetical protein
MGEERGTEGASGVSIGTLNALSGAGNETFSGTVPTTGTPPAGELTRPDFKSLVPAEFHDKPYMQDIMKSEDPYTAMFKAFAGAQDLLGRKSTGLELPGKDAPPEKIAEFRKALGVPEAPEKYEYKPPEGRQVNADGLKSMQAEAHKLGLTTEQFAGVMSFSDARDLALEKANTETTKKAAEKELADFKAVYGVNADTILARAKATAAKVLPQAIRDTGSQEIAMIELLKIIDEQVYRGDKIANPTSSATGGDGVGDTPEALQAAMMKVRAEVNPDTGKKILDNKMDPGYDAHMVKVMDLTKRLAESRKKTSGYS